MRGFLLFLLILLDRSSIIETRSELIHVFNIWRHGDRAPVRAFSSVEASQDPIFKNGLGNLTEQGLRHAYEMGEFLKKRYVDTGFISDSTQIHIRSTNHTRTQKTAWTAMDAIFPGQAVVLQVLQMDWMLKPNFLKCPVLEAIQEAKCPKFVKFRSDYAKSFDIYEYDLWRCMGLDKKVRHFGKDLESFRLMEGVLNEALNGYKFQGDTITRGHIEEARKMYRQVQRITLGIEDYHEPELLRVYSGELLNDWFSKIDEKINCLNDGQKCSSIVFNGYSSQDLQIFPLLEILSSTKIAVGDDAPLYTSGVFLELYRDTGKRNSYSVKAYYRRDHTNFLVDLTPKLPGCSGGTTCDLESFRSGIIGYSHKSNEIACNDLRRIQKRLAEIKRLGTKNGQVLSDKDPREKPDFSSSMTRNYFLTSIFPFLVQIYRF